MLDARRLGDGKGGLEHGLPMSGPPVAGLREAEIANPLFEYLLRLGDDRLVLGHRMSEWCGHGPILEEDIAMANIALDLIGQGSSLLKLAGEAEGAGRDEDALAYFRGEREFRNAQLVELPIGDFAFTIVRQFLFDAYSVLLWGALERCAFAPLAGIAAKALKEDRYHLRHTSEWVLRLGDGTGESRSRAQAALDAIVALHRGTVRVGRRGRGGPRARSRRRSCGDRVPLDANGRRRGTSRDAHAPSLWGFRERWTARTPHGVPRPHARRDADRRALGSRSEVVTGEESGAPTRERVLEILQQVKDPEIPVVSVVELGIVRAVAVEGGRVAITITPTYSGCPAMREIEQDIRSALHAGGIDAVTLETVHAPAWTTDWIGDEAREKLRSTASRLPGAAEHGGLVAIARRRAAAVCPRCGSSNTELKSEFGSTACKAIHVCNACGEPFDEFKAF